MRVGLTHSRGALPGLDKSLAECGFAVEWQPLVQTWTVPRSEALSARKLVGSGWLVFPSRPAVTAWAELGMPFEGANLATVGAGTASALWSRGIRTDLVGNGDAVSTARALLQVTSKGDSVGLVQGDRAGQRLRSLLESNGRVVRSAVVYRTSTTAWRGSPTDVTVIASPSAALAFGPELLSRTRPVAIGSVTARALTRLDARPTVAAAPDPSGVLRAVLHAAGAADALGAAIDHGHGLESAS